MRRLAIAAAALGQLAMLVGCGNPAVVFPPASSTTKPDTSLQGLFQSAPNTEIADNLANPAPLALPARIGLLYYGYQPAAQTEDQVIAVQQIDAALRAANVARSVVQIPASLIGTNESIDNIRKLASRFGVDVVVFVSGTRSVARAAAQPAGFFDQFSNKGAYEARTVLTALAMDVLSGRFVAPFQAIGKSGPVTLNPDDAGFSAASADLEGKSEIAAMLELKTQVLHALQPAAPASAAPTAAPSSAPSAPPAASPTPSPSATAAP